METIFGSQTKAQEILFLLKGVKEVVRQGFYASELVDVRKFCLEKGLFLVKSKFKVLLDGSGYSNKGMRVDVADERGMYLVYISKDEKKALLASYYELKGDDYNLGLVLGYPSCCVRFFCDNFSSVKTDLELESTNLWTNLSQRSKDCVLLSHFPCSSECRESVEMGKKYFAVLEKHDGRRAEEVKGLLKE
ncbi:DUF483 domain-containing protein [Candidatus Woesearchaeota archaeon]|nr:DUF483 domain-containing protein [Candidatus Woesearchaeota archaeon]